MKVWSVPLWLSLCAILLITSTGARKIGKPKSDVRKKKLKQLNEIELVLPHINKQELSVSHEETVVPVDRKKKKFVKSKKAGTVQRHTTKPTKRQKPQHKVPKKGKLKTKVRILADESAETKTTVSPEIEDVLNGVPGNVGQSKSTRDNSLPGWIPHLAKRKCGKCLWQECPPVDVMREHCPSGIVRDQCNCCPQCAGGVGMPCYLSGFAKIWLPPCGDDLECVPAYGSTDLDHPPEEAWGAKAESEGICSCMDRKPVCGSNNATYDNICEFREAASRLTLYTKTSVTILHQGPCNTAPKIDSRPSDAVAQIGDAVSFRCETSGFPLPRIMWFKSIQKKKKVIEDELPGYLTHAVTQMRGGPGKYQLTTWLSLDKVKNSDSGTYICRSSNDYGTVDGIASLKIINA